LGLSRFFLCSLDSSARLLRLPCRERERSFAFARLLRLFLRRSGEEDESEEEEEEEEEELEELETAFLARSRPLPM